MYKQNSFLEKPILKNNLSKNNENPFYTLLKF